MNGAELKGDGGEASEKPDDTPLAKDAQIYALTEDDYFRKNAEARLATLPQLLLPACVRFWAAWRSLHIRGLSSA